MAWTFCTSGAAIAKAGANANSTIIANGDTLADWSNEAENIICDIARVDLVDKYDSLTANGKNILSMLASNMIAQFIIHYDMSGYTTKREAETMLDILENQIRRNISFIENDRIKTYLSAT